MEPNVSLKLSKRADETFFGKAISNIGRVVYSSNFTIYTLLVATRRKSVLKAYNNYTHINDYKEEKKRDQINDKYTKAYANYISTLEKVITENIYSKMQKRAATVDEEAIMAKYYNVCNYKGTDEVGYRTRLEILCLNMDWSNVQSHKSEFVLEKYKEFYLFNIQELYKAQMRHSAILLANAKDGDRDQYEAIYSLIDVYIKEVLPILPENDTYNSIIKDYKRYVASIDDFENKSFLQLRKRLALLSFSGELFEFSLPVIAKEQCYEEIIEIARIIITNQYTEADKFASYEVLQDAIEEYIDNILAKRTYWPFENEKKEFETLNEKWQVMKKLARIDYDSYKRQREVLFIDYDKKIMSRKKVKLPEIIDYYHERLVILHALRSLSNKPKLMSCRLYSKRRIKEDSIVKILEKAAISPVTYKTELGSVTVDYNVIESISSYIEEPTNEEVKVTFPHIDVCEEKAEGIQENSIMNIVRYMVNKKGRFKKRRAL